jgi:hypothetical protein
MASLDTGMTKVNERLDIYNRIRGKRFILWLDEDEPHDTFSMNQINEMTGNDTVYARKNEIYITY